MTGHGAESYFVIGEGLLSESAEGRERAVMAADAAQAAPPFRFSRMGPRGTALGEANRKKLARAMTHGGGGAGAIPAGYTYLGQFVDHDLTFDKTAVMLGQNVSPAQLLQGRSPSLDLDSLYGAGPSDPASAAFYKDDRAPEDGADGGDRPRPGDGRARPPARRGHDGRAEAQGGHPRQAQRREPGGGADAPRLHPVPQPRRRHAARRHARPAALRARPRARGQALPVDAAPRLPAADLRAVRHRRRVHERAQGVRAARRSRPTSRRCRSSSPSPPSGSATR